MNTEIDITNLKSHGGSSFDIRKKAVLHYLFAVRGFQIFGKRERKLEIYNSDIFDWISERHQEYLPDIKVYKLDFSDVFKYFEDEKCLWHKKTVIDEHILLLDKFFKLPQVIKAKEIYESRHKTIKIETNSFKLRDSISINAPKQHIQLGEHGFNNFDDVFAPFKIKGNITAIEKTQIKGGIVLIYAVFRYSEKEKKENEHMLVTDLFDYYEEFRKQWENREFKKQGIKKKSIIANNCVRANQILSKCGLSIKFKLSKDEKEILMTK